MMPAWYEARTEPETRYEGVLRRRPSVAGPAGRTRLDFELEIGPGNALALYAPGQEEALRQEVDRRVVLLGKVVDLTTEGHGLELWLRPPPSNT
jgi:hypothetical protein